MDIFSARSLLALQAGASPDEIYEQYQKKKLERAGDTFIDHTFRRLYDKCFNVLTSTKSPQVQLPVSPSKPSSEDSICPICLEAMELAQEMCEIGCKHPYHKHCIDKWFAAGNNTCPYCRKESGALSPPASHLTNGFLMIAFTALLSAVWIATVGEDSSSEEDTQPELEPID